MTFNYKTFGVPVWSVAMAHQSDEDKMLAMRLYAQVQAEHEAMKRNLQTNMFGQPTIDGTCEEVLMLPAPP